jgi:hypothetical protein
MVLSGIGVEGTTEEHERYLEETLTKNRHFPWKICAWHKNQRDMQGGMKRDEVGWRAYQICQNHGAMIITGHEHSYARTRTLSAVGQRELHHGAVGKANRLSLAPGKTFVTCSGLGGHSRRPWNCDQHADEKWWASVFSTNYTLRNGVVIGPKNCAEDEAIYDQENGEFGALFIEFNNLGQENQARGRFVTTKGRVLDDYIISR